MSMKGIWGDTLRRLVDLQEAADKTITVRFEWVGA
jgi:hypothetical protein